MNPKELRIGNIISAGNDYPVTVVAISDNEIRTSEGDMYIEEASSMVITEDVLIRFRFKSNYPIASREFILDDLKLIDSYHLGFLCISKFWEAGIFIRYVHQLQNLYYSIKGEELLYE